MSNLWWRNFYLCVSLGMAWIAVLDSLLGEVILTAIAVTNVLCNLFFAWRWEMRMRKKDGGKKEDGSAGK